MINRRSFFQSITAFVVAPLLPVPKPFDIHRMPINDVLMLSSLDTGGFYIPLQFCGVRRCLD